MKKIKIRLYAAVIFTALLSISCLTTEQSAFLALEGGRLATGLGAQAGEAIKNSKNKKAAAEQQKAEEEKRQAEVAEKKRIAEEKRQAEAAEQRRLAEEQRQREEAQKQQAEILRTFTAAVNAKDTATVQRLIQEGFDAKSQLAEISDIESILFLLQAGVNSGWGELLDAAVLNDIEKLHRAAQNEAELNEWGGLALLQVIANKNPEAVKFLLDEGVAVSARCGYIAIGNDSADILRLLIKKGGLGATTSMLCTAVEYNYPDIVAVLIEEGAPVKWGGEADLLTPIMIAALYNNKEAAEVLLKKGASPLSDIWWWSNYHHEQVPLFIAIENDSAEVAELLLKYGAPANKDGYDSGPYYEKEEWEGLYPSGDRYTWVPPLVYAVKCNALKTIPILIKYKADPNAAIERYDGIISRYVKDETALWFAVKNNNTEIAQILIKAGATATSDVQAIAETTEMRKLLRSAAKQ